MKRTHQNMSMKRLNIDVADRSKRNSSVGFKPMNQSFEFQFFIELLLDRDKQTGVDQLQFHFGLVMDTFVSGNVGGNFIDRMGKQNRLSWQHVKGAGGNLGQQALVVLERDPVPVACDIDAQLVQFTRIRTRRTILKQFGMHAASEQVKIQLSDFWPDC